MNDLDSFDTSIRSLHGNIVAWHQRDYNPKKLFFSHHPNPNNDQKSSCKNIKVDIHILLVYETYIELDLCSKPVSIVRKPRSDDIASDYGNSHATQSVPDSLCTSKSGLSFRAVTCPNNFPLHSTTPVSSQGPFSTKQNDFTGSTRSRAKVKL